MYDVTQNEKLAMYGVTHVVARDGYSVMITGYKTVAIKNNNNEISLYVVKLIVHVS